MNPRIYKSKAAKQAEYREAKKVGMTCAQYRAALAAGTITPPLSFDEILDTQVYEGGYVNRGWFGQKGGGVTHDRKTHVVSSKPDGSGGYITACGKFYGQPQDKTQMVSDGEQPTCAKCQTIKVTPPMTHMFPVGSHGNSTMSPLCLLRAHKRARSGEEYIKAVGCPPTCKACLATVAASVYTEEEEEK